MLAEPWVAGAAKPNHLEAVSLTTKQLSCHCAFWYFCLMFALSNSLCLFLPDLASATQQDDQFVVLKVADNISSDRLQEAAQTLGKKLRVRVVCGPLFSRYKLVMVGPVSDAKQKHKASNIFKQLLPGLKITRVPVSRDANGNASIPTGQMIVQFIPQVSAEEANRQLHSLNLKIVESPKDNSQGRYVVEDGDDNLDRLKKSSALLKQSGRVQYATLDALTTLGH